MSVAMTVGTRVRIKSPLNVYHHPEHKGEAFNVEGLEGEIVAIHTTWKDRPISPNYPYEVRFMPKFVVHVGDHELEAIA
ncbi:MAG: ferredoxin-thioredoxin reductase variable chain [Pseudanabaena sp. ELA607]|jgi:hypothetical protein